MPDEITFETNRKQPHSQSPIALINYFAPEARVHPGGIVHQRFFTSDYGDLSSIVVICPIDVDAETQAAAWGMKLAELSRLPDGWDGYDAPSPSKKAILIAQAFVETLVRQKYGPKRVAPSVVGGVGITQRGNAKKVYVEVFNDGAVYALFSDGSSEPVSKQVISSHLAFRALIEEMREYLDA